MTAELPRVERSEDGHAVWIHECTDVSFNPATSTLPTGSTGWEWTSDGGLMPSIHCLNCGVHGFWVGGDRPYWRPC